MKLANTPKTSKRIARNENEKSLMDKLMTQINDLNT